MTISQFIKGCSQLALVAGIQVYKKCLLQIFSNRVKMKRELQPELKLITSTSLECAQIHLPTQL